MQTKYTMIHLWTISYNYRGRVKCFYCSAVGWKGGWDRTGGSWEKEWEGGSIRSPRVALLLLLLFVLRGPVEIGWGMPVRPVHTIEDTTVTDKQHNHGIGITRLQDGGLTTRLNFLHGWSIKLVLLVQLSSGFIGQRILSFVRKCIFTPTKAWKLFFFVSNVAVLWSFVKIIEFYWDFGGIIE